MKGMERSVNVNKTRKILNGNQAVARGFYEAGGQVATSYPGSPTVEILQSVKELGEETEAKIYSEFSVNEKVALEVGIGASFTGARTLCSMKHVGVNVAADPLMTFTQTQINGGFVLVTGDDPGMASSQNEQDNRHLGKFANMAILDPADPQEAKDFTKLALSLSEDFNMPIMLRITSRVCHSRGLVDIGDRHDHQISGFTHKLEDYAMIPPNTYPKQYLMKERIDKTATWANTAPINRYEPSKDGKKDVLIITSGLMYMNLLEIGLDLSIYKLGMVYPLPIEDIRQKAKDYKRVLVLEEMTPFIENELKIHGIDCQGKEWFSFTGELNSEDIEQGLLEAGIITKATYDVASPSSLTARPPMFCSGCPHRPVFDVLKKARVSVIGDIGCYSLAVLEPLKAVNSIISMGASIGIMKGMSKAQQLAGDDTPLVCVIGDGTFFHSGMTGMVNLLHQLDDDVNMTVLILNNGTTAMTGGQATAVTGSYSPMGDMDVHIPELLDAMGFTNVHVVDQFAYKTAKDTIDQQLKHKGLSIVMTTQPCALNFKIVNPPFQVDPAVCIGCRSCVKTNCPPIQMRDYEGFDKMKSHIAADMCVGCSVCAQVCPVGAISQVQVQEEA